MSQTLKPVALVLLLLYLFSSTVLYFIIKHAYDKEAFKRIEQTVNFEKAIHAYVSDYQKPAIYELVGQGKVSEDYFDPRVLSSTFISQHIFKNYNAQINNKAQGVKLRIVSDNPTNMVNLANSYEQKILEDFRKEEREDFFDYIEEDGKEYLFYAQSVGKNSAKCLQCHGAVEDAPNGMVKRYGKENGFNEKINDTHAIIALYTPVGQDRDEMYKVFFSIVVLSLAVFISIFLIIMYFAKKIIAKDKLITKQSKFAAMGEMIGMIAHQWRQPLTGIGMTVDNLKLDIELETIDEKVWSDNLESIKKQVLYLSHTVDDFRNFFKPNQTAQEVNLSQLMEDSLNIIHSALSKNGVKVYKIYEDEILVKTFRNDMMQVILNLLKNANDAFSERNIKDGEIKIGMYRSRSGFEIEVSDNAGGVSDDIVEKIFDPYFSTKDEKNGTGLGLYMSKMIVEDHLGGRLELITDDDGTSFVIKVKDMENEDGN